MGAILALISSFLTSKLGPPVFMVIGAVAALGWGMWYMENAAHEKTISEAAGKLAEQAAQTEKAVLANEVLAATNKTLTTQMAANAINNKVQQFEMSRLRKENNETNAKYDSMRSRLGPAMAGRPSLVARLANRATVVLVDGLEAETCRAGCGTDGSVEADATTGE